MSLENILYLLSTPWYIGLIVLTSVLIFTAKFGSRIYTWYEYKYQDFGTCRRCFGKQDNMWYLVCTKCHDKQMSLNKESMRA